MYYEIKEVEHKWQLDAIVDVLWAAMDGIEPSHAIFFPTFAQDRNCAIAESKDRLWSGHKMDLCSHWIYVLEGEQEPKRVVGGCQWRIYTENLFPDPGAKVNATFWPKGTGRDFASEVATQCHAQRKAWVGRPHAGKPHTVSPSCVFCQKDNGGIGSKLMEWGLQRMNELNIEGFVEASVPGRMLYRRFGFLDVAHVRVNMDHDNLPRTDPWRELEGKNLPSEYTAMWRPQQGNITAAEAKATWEERLKASVRAHVEQLI